MTDRHYPYIDDLVGWALHTAVTLTIEDHAYLTDPECPYDPKTKQFVKEVVAFRTGRSASSQAQPEVKKPLPPVSEDEIDSTLASDLHAVFRDLKDYGKGISATDQTERMAYFRTATSLLERLVNARERALGVKQIKDFQDTVLNIMEEICSPDQRTEVMDRLRQAIKRNDVEDLTDTTTEENA